MQIVILCGGQATRIHHIIGNTPKVLAQVNGMPFFNYLLNFIIRSKIITKITLLTGSGSEYIESYLMEKHINSLIPITILKDKSKNQGTSLAIHQALEENYLDKEFILSYGDSLPSLDITNFARAGRSSGSNIYFSFINPTLVHEQARMEVDGVRVKYISDLEHHDTAQLSKLFIDYGVYYIRMNQKLRILLKNQSDLKNVFALFSKENTCFGEEILTPFIEIGNPASFARAQEKLKGADVDDFVF